MIHAKKVGKTYLITKNPEIDNTRKTKIILSHLENLNLLSSKSEVIIIEAGRAIKLKNKNIVAIPLIQLIPKLSGSLWFP